MSELAYPRPYGTYLLLERLGAGGMSEVDLARRAVGEGGFVRFIVIKRIRASNQVDEQYVRMFQDEARINAELSHENIAQVYDFGREGDEFYMAMEYVPGLDLRAVQIALAQKGKLLPVRIALTVLVGVLRALQYAHARVDQLGRPMNIVHRDVNPRNVMLSVNGEVKLIDFGVAKAADRLEKTEGNTMKGKFAYMAPEQVQGDGAIDGRADVFAVALVLHELLTGRSPFAGLTEVQILHRILSGNIPALPDGIDHPDLPLLRRIHARGLAVRPEDRYPSADAFRADLEVALDPIGGLAPPRWIAELLREANGDGVSDITRRLRAYRDGAATGPKPAIVPPPPSESSGTLNVASIEVPPGRSLWMAFAAAGVGLSTVLLVGLAAGAAGFAWWFVSQPTTPEVVVTAPVVPQAEAVAAPVPEPPQVPTGAGGKPRTAHAPPEGKAGAGTPTAGMPTGSGSEGGATATGSTGGPTTVGTAGSGGASVASTGSTSGTTSTAEPGSLKTPTTGSVNAEPTGTGAATGTAATGTAATTTTAAATPTVPAKAPGGFLNLTSRPLKLDVYVDGAKVGVTPLRLFSIPAGTHEIAVRDPATGTSNTRTVVVGAGAVSTVIFE
ncbi:MAG: protein kinase [Pseudomonadota bacterium]|nr:protein kinase [Pseudomonadota bacterium]